MADSADLRTEGEKSSNQSAIDRRQQYRRLKAVGTCVMCQKAAVKNRSYCYSCSSKQSIATYRCGLRSFMKAAGFNLSFESITDDVDMLEQLKTSSSKSEQLLLAKLQMLLVEGGWMHK